MGREGGRSVESLRRSNNAAAPLMKWKMDGRRAIQLFRGPLPAARRRMNGTLKEA